MDSDWLIHILLILPMIYILKMRRIQCKSSVYRIWLWFYVEQCKMNTGCPRLSYTIYSHRYSVFCSPNSDFRTQLTNKHFEQSHSGAVKLSPELYFVSEQPIPVAAQVYGCSLAKIASSNPAEGMDVCFV